MSNTDQDNIIPVSFSIPTLTFVPDFDILKQDYERPIKRSKK